ncbi:PepSY-associated TM helix domain-containing protein [Salinimicrobium soli]|uniref:PepSY-associated TM helix domain-containing protein n=1 Tax=Salinimicrobium soli TaxID=1254399 RepID=UPI003AAE3998
MKNRTVLKYHSIAGLIAGLFLFLMGISGAILVFQHDIEDNLWKEYIEVRESGSLQIDRGIQTVQKQYPDWDTRLIHFQQGEALIFNLRKPQERLFVFVHPTSGEIIKEINELTTFTRWLLKFHYSLQAGPVGRIIVFCVGLLFLFSLLSGVYLYRKSFFKTLMFRTGITRNSRRSFYSSLHRTVGTWALIFNLLLVVTGTFLSYSVVAAGLNPPPAPKTPVISASVEDFLGKIEKEYPFFEATYVRLPVTASGEVRAFGFYEDDPFYTSEFGNIISADPVSGEILKVSRIKEGNLQEKLSNVLLPLHFGNYGGIWTKILYCLTGLSGPFLSITGFLLWRKKKKVIRKK